MLKPLWLFLGLIGPALVVGQVLEPDFIPLPAFQPPQVYTAVPTAKPPEIDGREDKAWNLASWSSDFVDIEGDVKPKPEQRTRFKMMWDKEFLYILARMDETQVWGTLTKRDAIIYRDNDFEVFIDPDGDTQHYLEVEVNALNTVFDLMLSKPYRFGGPMIKAWDLKQLLSAVHVEGTLNDGSDVDQFWQVELAIPLIDLVFSKARNLPKAGTEWRINFSRVHWDASWTGTTYQKDVNPNTGKPFPEHNWVWNPQGKINMHLPEQWGILRFGRTAMPSAEPPRIWKAEDKLEFMLRQIFDRQLKFKKRSGHFAERAEQLQLGPLSLDGTAVELTIEQGGAGLEMRLASEASDWTFYIDQYGRNWKTQTDE